MNCERCSTPIRDDEDATLLSWIEDRYAHTDCRPEAQA